MTELLQMSWLTTPAMAGYHVRHQLLECWREVSNAGGAVGFPFPPVSDEQVISSIDAMVRSAATEDLALEQLRLELRAGMGLEGFYQSCGWSEIGRWPAALRLPAGDRDEVLMALALHNSFEEPIGVISNAPTDWAGS